VSVTVWEAIFMLVVLKIPVVYLASVVWYAVRAEPEPAGGGGDEAGVLAPLAPLTPCGWDDWKRRRPTPYRYRPRRPSSPRLRTRARVA
jgi:hypothetical protein